MRIGISVSSTHSSDGPRLMIERARAAHSAGFSSLSIGDHHNMHVEYAQNTPMLGRLLAEWPDRPAGCLFLVPLWHPLLMAEQIGTLRATHQDRFIVQTGIGYGESQFAAFGTTTAVRGDAIDAAIPVVKALLEGETVDSGRFDIAGGRVGLRGDQPVEWWIGGGAAAALRRAAELGDVWYAGPGTTQQSAQPQLDAYRAAGGERAIVRKDALVLDDGDRARSLAAELVASGYRGMKMEQLLVGSADDAAEQIAGLAAVGFEEVIIRSMTVTQDVALETISTLGSLT